MGAGSTWSPRQKLTRVIIDRSRGFSVECGVRRLPGRNKNSLAAAEVFAERDLCDGAKVYFCDGRRGFLPGQRSRRRIDWLSAGKSWSPRFPSEVRSLPER